MKLKAWLDQQGMTDADFAARIEADRSTVSKLKRGKHNFSLDLMDRVVEATARAVMPNDLYEDARGASDVMQAGDVAA